MPPRLVLVNGIPASGKTTLARDWCELHAAQLPLCLDVDSIRWMIGGWRTAAADAGLAARDVAVAGIAAHLGNRRDVLVPQYLLRHDFIRRLHAVASSNGAVFVETALLIDAETATRRFTERADQAGIAEPWGALPADMASIASDFDGFLTTRPDAVRIDAGRAALQALDDAIRMHPSGGLHGA